MSSGETSGLRSLGMAKVSNMGKCGMYLAMASDTTGEDITQGRLVGIMQNYLQNSAPYWPPHPRDCASCCYCLWLELSQVPG